MTPARKALTGALTAALLLGLGTTALAQSSSAPAADLASTSADLMPAAIEDFNYPNSARLQQERGINLKRGDGHLWLTDVTALGDCLNPSNIAIEARTSDSSTAVFCFEADATSGYLTLELPATFNIWTQDRSVKATLTTEGKNTVVNAPADELTTVGEAGDTGMRSTLVELRITG